MRTWEGDTHDDTRYENLTGNSSLRCENRLNETIKGYEDLKGMKKK
jgi:hypothetical protein